MDAPRDLLQLLERAAPIDDSAVELGAELAKFGRNVRLGRAQPQHK